MKITYDQLIADSKELASKISKEEHFDNVYGVPSGGIIPAFIIASELKLPLVSKDKVNLNTLVVDDLVDSGETMKKLLLEFSSFKIAVLYKKKHSAIQPDYFVKEIGDEWIILPHEEEGVDVEKNITRLLQYIGEDPKREGLKDTPKRVIKSYKELFSGYKKDIKDILTVFESEKYDGMVLLKNIEFQSACEHHMLIFAGKAHVAYVPNGKVVGISKLARVVDIFSKRLQNQERLTTQIAEGLQEALGAKGVAVVMEAQHFCMKARGVNKQNSIMNTAHLTGVFRDDSKTRGEFYDLIK